MSKVELKVHRGHVIIQQVFADLKNSGLAHLPWGKFAAKSEWPIPATIAFNLTRARGVVAGRYYTPKPPPAHFGEAWSAFRPGLVFRPRLTLHLPGRDPGRTPGRPCSSTPSAHPPSHRPDQPAAHRLDQRHRGTA